MGTSHNRRPWLTALLGCAFLTVVELAGAQQLQRPRFAGERLPQPPKQKVDWTAPVTKLPESFVVATRTLFDLGLADPRGCDYRMIKLTIGIDQPFRGWVLPAEGKATERFAVCWNGLVYPVTSVGEKADLKADILAAIKADKAALEDQKDRFLDMLRFNPTSAAGEWTALTHETILPLKACLLLRIGEEELARELWSAWSDRIQDVNNNAEYKEKPFLVLAANWTWYAFDRALSAHIRGDDRLALLGARDLLPIQKETQAAAVKLGVQRYTTEGVRERVSKDRKSRELQTFQGEVQRPLFLQTPSALPALVADQERRAKEAPVPRQAPEPLDKAARIAALVRDLEEIQVPQFSQPGYPDFSEDQTVKRLVEQGDDAVEPLLEVLERDERLTRSVSFRRDFDPDRNIIGVYEPAYAALTAILQTSELNMAAGGNLTGRERIAAGARAYWKKYKGVPLEERWYRTLADDKAMPDQWLEAATRIVAPIDAAVKAKVVEAPRMRGEALRSKKDSTVATLMARRAADMTRPRDGVETPTLAETTRMALHLSRWDPSAALPTLKALAARCREKIDEQANHREPFMAMPGQQGPGQSLAEVTIARVRCGDAQALDEFAAWLRAEPASSLESSVPGIFEPIWRNPQHPAMAELADWLFNDRQSAWRPFLERPDYSITLIKTPLLGVAGFRKQVLLLLSNKSPCGTVELSEGGKTKIGNATITRSPGMSIKMAGGEMGTGYDEHDPLAKAGVLTRFRVCDHCAWELSQLDGVPNCQLYWPEKNRDEANAACVDFIRLYGDRFTFLDVANQPEDIFQGPRAILSFPLLGRPATPDDVRKGLAIFSLGDVPNVRLWPLPARPLKATWKDPKDPARVGRGGFIWQAEELRENGKLRRYYGFVGVHVCAKIPAEEIEISPTEGDR